MLTIVLHFILKVTVIYSSGRVEGRVSLGGFMGLDNGCRNWGSGDPTDTWKRVTYDKDGFVVLKGDDEIREGNSQYITGASGTLIFKCLKNGKYRITEISTVVGYNKLASDIEIDLPYGIAADYDGVNLIQHADTPDYIDGDTYYYRYVTLEITNTKHLNDLLPLTGANDFNFLTMLIGAIIIILGIILILSQIRKKKQKEKIT